MKDEVIVAVLSSSLLVAVWSCASWALSMSSDGAVAVPSIYCFHHMCCLTKIDSARITLVPAPAKPRGACKECAMSSGVKSEDDGRAMKRYVGSVGF